MGVPGVGGAGVRGAAAPVGVFRVLPRRVTAHWLIHCLEPSCLDFQAECVGAESAIAVGPKRADRMAGWVGQKILLFTD